MEVSWVNGWVEGLDIVCRTRWSDRRGRGKEREKEKKLSWLQKKRGKRKERKKR